MLIALATLFLAFALFLAFIYVRHYSSPLRKMPGHSWLAYPFTGDIGEYRSLKLRMEGWMNAHKAYGRTYRGCNYFGKFRVYTEDPEIAKEVLLTNSSRYKRGSYMGAEAFILLAGSENVLVTSGDVHKRLRKVSSPAFRPAVLKTCIEPFTWKAELLKQHWLEAATNCQSDSFVITVKDHLNRLSLDCLCATVLGISSDNIQNPSPIVDFMTTLINNFKLRPIGVLPFIETTLPWVHKLILSEHDTNWLTRLMPSIDGIKFSTPKQLVKLIRQRVVDAAAAPGLSSAETSRWSGCLLKIIQSNCESGSITEDEMIELLITFLFAGTETSSTAITWTLWLLAGHHDIQEAVIAEAKDYMESSGGKFVWEDVQNEETMPTLKLCLREAMRLYPPVPYVSRSNLDDTVIDGYHVPKGTDVLVVIMGLHRNSDLWGDDASDFNPYRDYPKDAFLPFGDGPHKCIGYQFANVEIVIVLATLLSSFRFNRIPNDNTEAVSAITTTADPPIQLRIARNS